MPKKLNKGLTIAVAICFLLTFTANASKWVDDSNYMSLLDALINECSGEEIIAIIQAGAEVNQPSEAGYYPFLAAILFNYGLDVIEAFLVAGANPHVLEYGDTALMYAVLNQHRDQVEIIKLLLNEGLSINARDLFGQTALHWAVSANARIAGGITENPKIIRLLLDAGANPNTRDIEGRTPLMIAAQYSQNLEVIRFLLAAGADQTLKCMENKTALDYARENEKLWDTEVLQLLD